MNDTNKKWSIKFALSSKVLIGTNLIRNGLFCVCIGLAACGQPSKMDAHSDGGTDNPNDDAIGGSNWLDASFDSTRCDDPDDDGYGIGAGCLGSDCAPNDPEINPGKPELCDGIDNNCKYGADEFESCILNRLQVFVLAGQSNMVGLGRNEDLAAAENGIVSNTTIYYNDSIHTNINAEVWKPLGPGFGGAESRFGPELSFGSQLQLLWPGRNIAIIKVAEGATGLHDRWLAPTGDLYGLLVNEVTKGLTVLSKQWKPEISGIIWMQGEDDSVNLDTANAYHGNLNAFMSSLRMAAGLEFLPVVAGLISKSPLWIHSDIIRNSTMQVAGELGQMNFVETDDLPRFLDDPAHYSSQSNIDLGKRFADSLAGMLASDFHFPAGFSGVQGDGFWTYESTDNGTMAPMNYDSTSNIWTGKSGQLVGEGWVHPSNDGDVSLLWWAHNSGIAKVDVSVSIPYAGGDGVLITGYIDGTIVWGPATVDANTPLTATKDITFSQGQKIEFRTESGASNDSSYDTTLWNIDITWNE